MMIFEIMIIVRVQEYEECGIVAELLLYPKTTDHSPNFY